LTIFGEKNWRFYQKPMLSVPGRPEIEQSASGAPESRWCGPEPRCKAIPDRSHRAERQTEMDHAKRDVGIDIKFC
jgi:hypothetical protein